MILEERGRPLVRNRRRDKNGGVCLARPVCVVDMLSRCIRRHSTRDEKITATLHASSTSSGVEAKQSCLQTRVSGVVKAHVAAVRGLPSFSEVGHAGAPRGFRGSPPGPLWWALVSWPWIWVSARRHNGAVALAEMVVFPWSFRHFFLQRDGRRLTRGHGGEREEQTQQSSGQGPRAKREGPRRGGGRPHDFPKP